MASVLKSEIAKMKVAELKKELKDRGLVVSGNKTELAERLQLAVDTEDTVTSGTDEPVAAQADADEVPAHVEEDLLDVDDDDVVTTSQAPVEPPSDSTSQPAAQPSDTQSTTQTTEETHAQNTDKTDDEPTTESKAVKLSQAKQLTDAEKQKLRAQKFGLPMPEDARKQSRAERFGLAVKDSAKTTGATASSDKLKSRAERFGLTKVTSPTSPTDSKPKTDHFDKLKSRAERFGAVVSSSLSTAEQQEKILKRKERFGAVTAPTTTTSKASANGAVTSPTTTSKSSANTDDVLKRKERFGTITAPSSDTDDVAAKKQRRADRFRITVA